MLFHFRLWPSHLHHAPHLFHVGVVWRPFKPVKNRKTGRKKKSTQSFPFTLDVDHTLCPQVEATATFGSAFYLNACRQLQRASWCLKDIHPPACCCVCVCAGLFNFLCVFAQKRAEEKERKKNWITEGEMCCIIPQHHFSDITSLHSENSLHPEGAASAPEVMTASTL